MTELNDPLVPPLTKKEKDTPVIGQRVTLVGFLSFLAFAGANFPPLADALRPMLSAKGLLWLNAIGALLIYVTAILNRNATKVAYEEAKTEIKAVKAEVVHTKAIAQNAGDQAKDAVQAVSAALKDGPGKLRL